MKFRTTGKAIKEGFPGVVSAGYCSLQSLLRFENPVAYTSGTYGWNYDVYDLDGIALCTGYRSMPGPTATKIKEYEDKAKEIMKDFTWDNSDEIKEKMNVLVKEFRQEQYEMLFGKPVDIRSV